MYVQCSFKSSIRNVTKCITFPARNFSCDWYDHLHSVMVYGSRDGYRCCPEKTKDRCGWLACKDCYVRGTYGLKAAHQVYGLQVTTFSSGCCYILTIP
jgi:hypothetical protein